MSEKRGKFPRRGAVGCDLIGALILAASVALGLAGGFAAEAQARGGATAVSGPVFAWMLLDAETGQVLSEQNADVLTYPASLTKMMTLYLTFEALNQGRIRTDQLFTVSAFAASRSPSKLGLTPGEAVPLRDLILGLVTRSANDAASVIAENLAGSEANFARYMTWKARQLGMQHTWYQNASGLPDPSQRTTARDVARLSLALYHDFPREYRYFSTQEFYFRGDEINTHNHLLEWYPGADGIKTGFVNASGFNIATSAVRNGRRLIGVIMGGRSARSRDVQWHRCSIRASRRSEPPAGAAFGRGGSTGPRASSSTAIAASAPPASAVVAASAAAPTASAITAAAGPRHPPVMRSQRRCLLRQSPRRKPRPLRRHAQSCRWSRLLQPSMTRRMTTQAIPKTARAARCAGLPAPRCGIWRRYRKRRLRPPFTSGRLPRRAGASSSAPIAISRRRVRRCAEPPASMR